MSRPNERAGGLAAHVPPPRTVAAGWTAAAATALSRPAAAARLRAASVSVRIEVAGAEDDALVLRLDRDPADVGPAGAAADVAVVGPATVLHRFWTGEEHLALAIVRGDVAFAGPVRALLRVVPILRAEADAYLEAVTGRGGEAAMGRPA